MDSQYSNKLLLYDSNFLKLLEVKCGWLKRRKFKNAIKHSKEFYKAYVKKCNEYDVYIDFFTPLYWHLICSGVDEKTIKEYLSEIRNGITEYLKSSIPDDMLKGMNINEN